MGETVSRSPTEGALEKGACTILVNEVKKRRGSFSSPPSSFNRRRVIIKNKHKFSFTFFSSRGWRFNPGGGVELWV